MTMLDLDAYTDPDVMRGRLQRGLPGFAELGLEIEHLEVMHAHRRAPRRNPQSEVCRIAVCYRAGIGGTGMARARTQILYGKVLPPSAAQRELARSGERPGAASRPVWVESLDMLVWSFPDDPGLPQLRALLEPHPSLAGLPMPLRAEIRARRTDGALLAPELVRYRPEERATLRWRLPRGTTLYAKTFAGEEGAALHQRFAGFAARAGERDAFEVAPPIGYDAGTRTFWQRGVVARGLSEALTEENCAGLMKRVARGLAHLHGLDLPAGQRRALADLSEAAQRRARKLARCLPEHAEAAARVGETIATHAGRFPNAPEGLIHGDFHIEQLRLRGQRVVVFDFDEFARGDPLEDLASFAVKCALADEQLARSASDRLAEWYARARPDAFDARRLAWHLAVQWLHKASRAYVWQRPNWRDEVRRTLEAARRCGSALDEKGRTH